MNREPHGECISAAELLEKIFPPVTAGELVAKGECWPTCLVAACEVEDCGCPCNGAYHGALLGVEVECDSWLSHESWWVKAGYPTFLLDREIPTIRRRGQPSIVDPEFGKIRVQKVGGRYEGTWDIDIRPSFAEPTPPRLSDVDQEHIAELGRALLRANRARITSVSCDLVCIYGCRTALDAKAFLFIAMELFMGNVDGWINTMDVFCVNS